MAQAEGSGARPENFTSPAPGTYPSPAMRPTYAYPPHEHEGSDAYRGPPGNSLISLPPLNLPPIRSIEGIHSTYQQHQLPGEGIKLEPLHTPGGPGPGGYYQPAAQPSAYPQPPMHLGPPPQYNGYQQAAQQMQDQRMLAASRHKKEIKRRTKTGCLTCRKRRIKCDETHPTCRNCQKSKRQCAGYDPIFKQSQPPLFYPVTINQAGLPIPQPSRTSTASSTPAASYSPVPQGYAPAAGTEAYHQELVNALRPTLPPMDPRYDYNNAAIDPALGSGEQPLVSSHIPYDPVQDLRPNAQSPYARDATFASSRPASANSGPKARRIINVDELYMIGGVDPPTPRYTKPLTHEICKEVEYMSVTEYAKGIDQVLETTWYNSHGMALMMEDKEMVGMFAGMLELFRNTKESDYDAMRMVPSTESKVIWSIMSLPRRIQGRFKSQAPDNNTTSRDEEGIVEVTNRIAILEKLLTGQVLEVNPLASQPTPTPLGYTGRQKKFWHLLGQFVSIPPTENLDFAESILAQLRQVLDELEGRDVLYSIAIVRHIGAQIADFPAGIDGPFNGTAGAMEDRTKLRVAKKFIEDEAAGKGTTQVIQRLCAMAVRSWGMQRT